MYGRWFRKVLVIFALVSTSGEGENLSHAAPTGDGHGAKNPISFSIGSNTIRTMEMWVQNDNGFYTATPWVSDSELTPSGLKPKAWAPIVFPGHGGPGTGVQAYNFPLAKIGENGVTKIIAGDGSLLITDYQAPTRYSTLGANFIFWTTTLHTFVPDQPNENPDTGTWTYRVALFGSADGGLNWIYFPAIAVTTGHSTNGNADHGVGIWSNRLFERSDGTIFVYFDDQALALADGYDGGQYTAFTQLLSANLHVSSTLQLLPNSVLSWTPINLEHVARGRDSFLNGSPPARGMASISEQCSKQANGKRGIYGQKDITCTLILTEEDDYSVPTPSNPQHVDLSASHGIILVSMSLSGGGSQENWTTIAKLEQNWPSASGLQSYAMLAPAHFRDPITGKLILVVRTDMWRNSDPNYISSAAAKEAIQSGDPTYFMAQDVVYTSSDGFHWTLNTDFQIGKGYGACTSDPGVSQFPTNNSSYSYAVVNYLQFGFLDTHGVFHVPPANACNWSVAQACSQHSANDCPLEGVGCYVDANPKTNVKLCRAFPVSSLFLTDYMLIQP